MVTAILIILVINTGIAAWAVFFKDRAKKKAPMSEEERQIAEEAERREREYDNMMNYSGGPKR